jgi:3-dehydroquinate synthase II
MPDPASVADTAAATGPHGRIPLWVDLRHVPRNKRLGYLGAARAANAQAILLAGGDEHVGKDGLTTIAVDGAGALRNGRVRLGRIVTVTDAASQRSAGTGKGIVVVDAPDWRIIPLENLIAARRDRPGTLYAQAATPQQALLFAQTLQTGVHGIVLAPRHPTDIGEVDTLLRAAHHPPPSPTMAQPDPAPTNSIVVPVPAAVGGRPTIVLVESRITRIEDAGLGDRVCIDCTGLFQPGEGLLVGSTARSFALVHAETVPSDLVPTRPFRVNAGAIHSYLLGPAGRTCYLSEVAAGTRVLAAAATGSREMTVGRAKVESRPHLLIAWQEGSAVLQNAETVRLLTPQGPRSVTQLKPGDAILVHHETAARHTGLPVDARMEER